MQMFLVLCLFFLSSCSSLEKDNEPKTPVAQEMVKAKLDIYRPLVRENFDSYGLVVMGESIGDSALFSCLARASGAADFDPLILLKDGKPVRHPEHKPAELPNSKGSRGTPISKDMVNGILWCAYDLIRNGDTDRASELLSQMIEFGKKHKLSVVGEVGWLYCTEEDRQFYQITDDDWLGKCFMPPAVVKDIYRVAKKAGLPCDNDCQFYSTIGANIPNDRTGFERHLGVLTTIRNGFVDGAINDNSLEMLKRAAEAEPRNALYNAAYHIFGDGNQEVAFRGLMDETLFPSTELPTQKNYCTDYLFQRDEAGNKDWLPCPEKAEGKGRGVEFIFAASLALGEIR